MGTSLNSVGAAHARSLVSSGDVDKSSAWSFSAEDGDALLGEEGDDWGSYAQWFLAVHDDQPDDTKAHYGYPFGKNGKVYRSALVAIRQRAGQQGATALESLSGKLLAQIDGEKRVSPPVVRLRPVQEMGPALSVKDALRCMHTAHATWDIKEANEVSGIITGLASTPTVDRQGDIMEPRGAMFNLPIPLLWQHNPKQPIGHVIAAYAGEKGIEITARIARGVAPFIDEAWALIKAGLVRGLSIGFKGLEAEPVKSSAVSGGMYAGGMRFLKWSWLELSAVTIPANMEANIVSIKSADEPYLRAALGDPQRKGRIVRLST